MKLKIIGSSSAGNAYILENDQEALLIECGVRWEKIKRALAYNLKKVVGCIVTHEHGDHSMSIKHLLSSGIDVYSSLGTIKALGVDKHHRAKSVDNQPFKLGGFKIMTFDVKHDCADPVGFLIDHEECGLVLFLTDTYFIPYTFPGLNNMLVEANYCQDIIDQRLVDGRGNAFVRDRVLSSHMSIKTCKEMLQANDLSQVNNIVLIHLSDSNSHEERFVREVRELTGKTVTAARPGVEMDFNKSPY